MAEAEDRQIDIEEEDKKEEEDREGEEATQLQEPIFAAVTSSSPNKRSGPYAGPKSQIWQQQQQPAGEEEANGFIPGVHGPPAVEVQAPSTPLAAPQNLFGIITPSTASTTAISSTGSLPPGMDPALFAALGILFDMKLNPLMENVKKELDEHKSAVEVSVKKQLDEKLSPLERRIIALEESKSAGGSAMSVGGSSAGGYKPNYRPGPHEPRYIEAKGFVES